MPSLPVQIIAPVGRDAELLARFLNENGAAGQVLPHPLAQLTAEERDSTGALLVAEEALTHDMIPRLGELLAQQPTWSDLPFLLLVSSGRETSADAARERERLPLGNLTVLERPLRPSSLLSAVRAALRARRRQYEVRDATAALRMSEQRSRLILESTHDCIKLLDLDGNLLHMNEEGRQRLGITDFGKVCGTPWLSLFRSAEQGRVQAAVEAARAGNVGSFEGLFARPDCEPMWWDISVTPVRDDAGEIVQLLAVSREITHRKRTEEALIQSEKLAAVGRLASTISHEINNPLEAVTNLIYIAMHHDGLPEEVAATLTLADEELKRTSQIVGQTLRFHRQSTRRRWVTPEELVSSVLGLYRGRLANYSVTAEVEHRPGAAVSCFDGEIRQVLSNLVGNAVDAMRNGGRLRIRSRAATDAKTGQSGAFITVADTGHGMPPEVANRIFEAFYSTKGDNGTGLGLWITRGIVDKHQGSLHFRTRRGDPGGTVFLMFLPKTAAE